MFSSNTTNFRMRDLSEPYQFSYMCVCVCVPMLESHTYVFVIPTNCLDQRMKWFRTMKEKKMFSRFYYYVNYYYCMFNFATILFKKIQIHTRT